jgi:hypothetical protein
MSFLRRTLRAAARRLAARVDELCNTLDTIAARVRAATADAIGETITDIVRDAAIFAFDRISPNVRGPSSSRTSSRYRRTPNQDDLWNTDNEEDDDDFDESDFDQDEADPGYVDTAAPDRVDRMSIAVSAGLQVAAWWIKRQTGRGGVLMSMAVSIVATGLAYFAGPFTRAVFVLVASATRCGT